MNDIVALIISLFTIIIYYIFKCIQPEDKLYTAGVEIIYENIKECINKFNKGGVFNRILAKTLEPVMMVSDITERLPYDRTCSYYTTMHLGQMKLLMGELYFCTLIAKTKDDPFIMVYAGSAPNHKGFILNDLFPNMKTLLVDPAEHLLYTSGGGNHYNTKNILYFCCAEGNKFNIKSRFINMYDGEKVILVDRDSARARELSSQWKSSDKSIYKKLFSLPYNNYIIEDYFDDDIAYFCKDLPNVVFISDIRTNAHGEGLNKDVTDLDICVNSAMMLSWVNIMKPRLSMLKFRPPYFLKHERAIFDKYCNTGMYKYYFDKTRGEIDFVSDYRKKRFNYIVGEELIQAYAGTTSGETRLIFSDIKIKLVDHISREEKLFYYNQVRRQYGYHKTTVDSISGIDNCADCSLSQKIITLYNEKFHNVLPVDEFIKNSVIMLRRSLTIDNHGEFYSINNTMNDVYRQQANILAKKYFANNMRNRHDKLRSVDFSIEKLYQLRKLIKTLPQIVEKYNFNKQYGTKPLEYALIKYMKNDQIWSDHNSVKKWVYYDMCIKYGMEDKDIVKLLDEFDEMILNINDTTIGDVAMKYDNAVVKSIIAQDYITISYRDFSINISNQWDYLHYDKTELLKGILLDARIDADGFMQPPQLINDIITMLDYTIYEISLGLHDKMFARDFKYNHYTFTPSSASKSLEDLRGDIPPKTIIVMIMHLSPLLVEYLYSKLRSDTLLMLIAQVPPDFKAIFKGYRISFPYKSIDFMQNSVKFYAATTAYYFNGSVELLYKIKEYENKKMNNYLFNR